MIVVRIELWPQGQKARARHLGTAQIWNDGTGDRGRGNYHVTLSKWGSRETWRAGLLQGFPRLHLGPWDLLLRALIATVGKRNRADNEDLDLEWQRRAGHDEDAQTDLDLDQQRRTS